MRLVLVIQVQACREWSQVNPGSYILRRYVGSQHRDEGIDAKLPGKASKHK